MEDEFSLYFKKMGLKVSYYRKVMGLTQEQFAEKVGVDTSFIGKIEGPNIDKRITLNTLFRLAQALDIPPYKLLYFED